METKYLFESRNTDLGDKVKCEYDEKGVYITESENTVFLTYNVLDALLRQSKLLNTLIYKQE